MHKNTTTKELTPIITYFTLQYQGQLFDSIEYAVSEKLSDKLKELVRIWDLLDFSSFLRSPSSQLRGRPEHDRRSIARAFVAKSFYNLPTTEALVELLNHHRTLRMLCGFENRRQVPSPATFSRALAEFTKLSLCDKIHQLLIDQHVGEKLVMHISRDSTEVIAREKAVKTEKPKKTDKPKFPCGRPRKGEIRPDPEPTVLEKQSKEKDPNISINQLPKVCNWGCKKDSGGHIHTWKGYKAHIDWGDDEVPVTVVTTSASVHDSQVAIPLSQLTSKRCLHQYELMDSAYDADAIRTFIKDNDHVPIIDANKRNGTVPAEKLMDPATKERYNTRSTAERGNSLLKDGFGLRNLRVRGHAKAHTHIMFSIITLFVSRIIRPLPEKT